MDKKPKTKEVVHALKEHAVAEVKDKVHTAGIKSKDRVLEQVKKEATHQTPAPNRQNEPQSAESYATDRVEDTAHNLTENAAYAGVRAVKYGVQKIREHRAETQAAQEINPESMEDVISQEAPDLPQITESQVGSVHELPEGAETVHPRVPNTQSTATTTSANNPVPHQPTAKGEASGEVLSTGKEDAVHTHRAMKTKPDSTTEPQKETSEAMQSAPSRIIKQKDAQSIKDPSETIKEKATSVKNATDVKAPKGRTTENSISSDNSATSPDIKRRTQSVKTKQDAAKEKVPSIQENTESKTPKGRVDTGGSPAERSKAASLDKQKAQSVVGNGKTDSLTDEPSTAIPTKSTEKTTDIKTRNREVKSPDSLPVKEKGEQHPQVKKQTIKAKDTTASQKEELTSGKPDVEKKEPPAKKLSTVQKKAESSKAKVTTASGKTNGAAAKRIAPKQKVKTPPKLHQKPTLQAARLEKPMVKTPPAAMKQIKQGTAAAQGTAKTIKTVSEATKAAEKTTEKTAKAARKTTKAAKQTEKRAKQAVQLSKKAAQATAKAVVQAVKASAKAVEGLAELLGVSAPVGLLIIVVCLIAAIGGPCFGIFLSNDNSSGSEMTMSQAITQLTTDYYDSITKFQAQYDYDDLEVKGDTSINWRDVLTIYAVKYTNDSDGFDVVTLDKKKLKKIKEILLDMNPCTGIVVTKVVPVTKETTNSSGQKVTTTTYENQKVLVVTAVHVPASEQAKLYDFKKDAKAQVKELLSSDYDDMWNELIGSSGEIIISSSTHVPNFIFAWPLDGDYRISSEFGTRTDPITGVVKTHGGTDIAAAQGTPILAAADGVVEIAGFNAGGYGYYVKIAHGNGYETLYGHCSVLLVSTGQAVKQGQFIAKVGSTGHSTGPHLHFEVRYNGNKVNPMQFFK